MLTSGQQERKSKQRKIRNSEYYDMEGTLDRLYLIYVKIIVTHFGGTWKVPVVPMEIIVLLVLVSCILAVYAPAKRIRNMAITATINEL